MSCFGNIKTDQQDGSFGPIGEYHESGVWEGNIFRITTGKWYMIKNILLKQENINVSDKDINEKIAEFEKQNPTQVNEIKKFYKDEKNQSKLKEDLINYKLFNILEKYFINKVKEISTDKIRNKKG